MYRDKNPFRPDRWSAAVHELSIAQSILDTAVAAAADHGGGRIQAVRLRIGGLCQVIGWTLTEAFAALAAGTAAEGAALEIDWVPTVWRCTACRQTRPADSDAAGCPCGRPSAADRLEGSNEMLVTSLDLE